MLFRQVSVGVANMGTIPLEGRAPVVDLMIVEIKVEQSGLHPCNNPVDECRLQHQIGKHFVKRNAILVEHLDFPVIPIFILCS